MKETAYLEKKYNLYQIIIIGILFFLTVFLSLFWVINTQHNFIVYVPGEKGRLGTLPASLFLTGHLIWFLLAGTFFYVFYRHKLIIKKINKQNNYEKFQLENELNFLKNQFDSHVTFNFLNYCYSYVHNTEEKAAESIELFSNMLRYAFNTNPSEKVLLKSELAYIKDFIALQKLLTTKAYVDFNCQGQANGEKILPRILITFVENAFKHGLYNDPQYPIKINCVITPEIIIFSVKNKISERKTIIHKGISIKEVKQLLELYYPQKFSLKTVKEENIHYSELSLTV